MCYYDHATMMTLRLERWAEMEAEVKRHPPPTPRSPIWTRMAGWLRRRRSAPKTPVPATPAC